MRECEKAEVKLHIFFNSGPYGPGKLQATNPFNTVL
jgi:hypothetical protein